jgi:hypothetical protein
MTLRTARARVGFFAAAAALFVAVWPVAASASGILRDPDPVKQVTGVISEVKDTVTSVVGDAVDSVGQVAGSSSGSTSETTNTGGSASASSTSAPAANTSASTRSAPASTRSARALYSPGASSLGATAASSLYQAFAPPPPRYGGLSGGTLAITGLDFLLPLGVLVVLLGIGLATQTIQRVRDYGTLRYRGRHRMPSRWRPQLSPAF